MRKAAGTTVPQKADFTHYSLSTFKYIQIWTALTCQDQKGCLRMWVFTVRQWWSYSKRKTHLDTVEHLFNIVCVRRHRLMHKKNPFVPVDTIPLPWKTFVCIWSFLCLIVLSLSYILPSSQRPCAPPGTYAWWSPLPPWDWWQSDICGIGRKVSHILVKIRYWRFW